MQDWRAIQPVDVARLNSGIFLAVLRTLARIAVIGSPVCLGSILLLAEIRAPHLSIGFVIAHVWLSLVTALLGHLVVGVLVCGFALTVTSLVCWRHVFGRGGPNVVLALPSLALCVAQRLARRLNTAL